MGVAGGDGEERVETDRGVVYSPDRRRVTGGSESVTCPVRESSATDLKGMCDRSTVLV